MLLTYEVSSLNVELLDLARFLGGYINMVNEAIKTVLFSECSFS